MYITCPELTVYMVCYSQAARNLYRGALSLPILRELWHPGAGRWRQHPWESFCLEWRGPPHPPHRIDLVIYGRSQEHQEAGLWLVKEDSYYKTEYPGHLQDQIKSFKISLSNPGKPSVRPTTQIRVWVVMSMYCNVKRGTVPLGSRHSWFKVYFTLWMCAVPLYAHTVHFKWFTEA